VSVLETPGPVEDGALRALDPRWVRLQREAGWIFWAFATAVLFTGAAVVAFAAGGHRVVTAVAALGAAAVSALLAWLAQAWPEVEYRRSAYRVDADGIEIRRGVVWRHVITVARSRVQHTDVSQGPLERRHGLATLQIFTAGTDHAQVDLPGLDHATATRVRDHLLPGGTDDAV
jgi:membrane protein YdbS with pleckstrin-like domain